MTESITTREQVIQALATFQEAHRAAEAAAAEFLDVKRQVGSNEAERKALKASTPADHYEIMVSLLPDAEARHKEAAAHLERTEKNLNVLRELLNSETADKLLSYSAERAMTATIEDTTAQRYVMASARQVPRFFTTKPPAADDGSDVPF